MDNKHYAKRVIEDFNEACLLKIQGEKYKKEYYSKEDIILQEWLERKRISCTHEENLSPIFYEREILEGNMQMWVDAEDSLELYWISILYVPRPLIIRWTWHISLPLICPKIPTIMLRYYFTRMVGTQENFLHT